MQYPDLGKHLKVILISSKIDRTNASNSILEEIHALILKRKKYERKFSIFRKILLSKKRAIVINSSNWEDWKLLSLKYDEMKKIILDIDKKWADLKRLRRQLRQTKI